MKHLILPPLGLLLIGSFSGCGPGISGSQPSTTVIGQPERRGLVQSGDTVYETLPGSAVPDISRPVRKLGPGETFDANNQNAAAPAPHAQTSEEGEALENRMAKEAEEKAKSDQDPANQARKSIDDIERQVQEQQVKAEGNSN